MKREEGSWERGKNFSKPATPWGSRKKIFYVRHVVGKSEKWGSQKKIFHVPRLSEQLHED